MLRLILVIVILILILSFFGISLQNLFNAPLAQANFGFAWQIVLNGWNILVQFFLSVLAVFGIHAT